MERMLIPLFENDVAPRFDLATDVLIVDRDGDDLREKVIVLTRASAEELCKLILTENVNAVICGGIEEQYRQFLTWKGIEVLDGVMGPVDLVLERHMEGALESGASLYESEP